MPDNKDIIETVLKEGSENIEFEPIPDEDTSPLAEPVISKNNTSGDVKASQQQNTQEQKKPENKEEKKDAPKGNSDTTGTKSIGEQTNEQSPPPPSPEEESDAPEQEVDAEQEEIIDPDNPEGEFQLPLEQAKLMADTILGVANNVLEVGGGFFVTIRKHKDFYDFEEVIQIVDEQNVKNIKRLKLDAEDKALLRPLLIHVLRKKSKIATPEQQLLAVALSIIIKKAKVVMEIRKENEMIVDRIRDVIRMELERHEARQVSNAETGGKSEKQQATGSDLSDDNEDNERDQHQRDEVVFEEVK